jgi:predicted flap endonuclease-1-like 5' DNA nuclease
VDAIRENKTQKAAEPVSRPDMAGLRSVRSQALRGDGSALGGRIDDLKRVRGIGVLIEKRLNALGITSYEQIANWTKADIDSVSSQLDFKGRIERENWIEQARILASGGQTEFSRRVDRGEVETSKDS